MQLSWEEFVDIANESLINRFKPPDWYEVEALVAEKLCVMKNKTFHKRIRMVMLRNRYLRQKKLLKSPGKHSSPCSSEIVLRSEDFEEIACCSSDIQRKRKSKPLLNLGNRNFKRRIYSILSFLTSNVRHFEQ